MEWPFNHGVIDRVEAERRIIAHNTAGSYLVRMRTAGDPNFAYSYLNGKSNEVIHARVEVTAEAVTIDGTVVPSLAPSSDMMAIVSFLNETRRKVGDVVSSYVPRTSDQSFNTSPMKPQHSSVRGGPSVRGGQGSKPSGSVRAAKQLGPGGALDGDVIREGMMSKRSVTRGFFSHKWHQKHFKLTATDLTWSDKKNGKEQGRAALNKVISIERSDPKEIKKKFVFELTIKQMTMHFQCPNQEEREKWISKLREALDSNEVDNPYYQSETMKRRLSSARNPQAGDPNAHDLSHLAEKWYCGSLSREECNAAVCSGDPGDFLVRDSSDGKKMVIVLNDYGSPANYQVVPSPNGKYLVSTAEYTKLADVLASMRKNHPNGNSGKPLPLANSAKWQTGSARAAPSDAAEHWKCGMCGCYGEVDTDDTCPVCGAAKGADGGGDDAAALPELPPATAPRSLGQGPDIYMAPLDEHAFESLDPRETFPEELPPYCRGAHGNRYWDILPNPITRVRLPVLDNDQKTEYVNANFIRGYGRETSKAYIAAQGPLASSLENFLRMIWIHNVHVVVMITGLIELGKRKCERYWPETPDEPMIIGDFKLVLDDTTFDDGYRKHMLKISHLGEVRTITHFWFTSWPDHGVPENTMGEMDPKAALKMLQEARRAQKTHQALNPQMKSPMLVHCSAGIGRTGTFIVIDHVISALQKRIPDHVDINEIVHQIREDRMGMIQHTSQYKFAYQACVDFAIRLFGREAKLLSIAKNDNLTLSEGMRRESMKKNGAYKIYKLEEDRTVYQMQDNAPALRTNEGDREIFVTSVEPERTGADSPSIRKKLSMKPLSKQSWFRSHFSRAQVQEVLDNQPVGTFICRESSQKGMYAISVQQGGHISNVLCIPERNDQGEIMYKFGDRGDILFHTITEMITHFMKYPYTQHTETGQLLILRAPGSSASVAGEGHDLSGTAAC